MLLRNAKEPSFLGVACTSKLDWSVPSAVSPVVVWELAMEFVAFTAVGADVDVVES